jgi:hypothetical protein
MGSAPDLAINYPQPTFTLTAPALPATVSGTISVQGSVTASGALASPVTVDLVWQNPGGFTNPAPSFVAPKRIGSVDVAAGASSANISLSFDTTQVSDTFFGKTYCLLVTSGAYNQQFCGLGVSNCPSIGQQYPKMAMTAPTNLATDGIESGTIEVAGYVQFPACHPFIGTGGGEPPSLKVVISGNGVADVLIGTTGAQFGQSLVNFDFSFDTTKVPNGPYYNFAIYFQNWTTGLGQSFGGVTVQN